MSKFNIVKKIILIFIVLSVRLAAQDTIRFKSGEVKAVRVNEVGLSEIKYNSFNNLDGPSYIVNKSDIASIKYKNGQVDTFAPVVTGNPNPNVSVVSVSEDKILIRGKKLYYMNSKRGIGESRLAKIVNLCPDVNKQNKMIPVLQEMKSYKKKQYAVGFSCLGAAVALAYGGFVGALVAEDPSFLIAIPVGAAVGITGAVVSSIFKHKRIAKKLEVARIYNGEK